LTGTRFNGSRSRPMLLGRFESWAWLRKSNPAQSLNWRRDPFQEISGSLLIFPRSQTPESCFSFRITGRRTTPTSPITERWALRSGQPHLKITPPSSWRPIDQTASRSLARCEYLTSPLRCSAHRAEDRPTSEHPSVRAIAMDAQSRRHFTGKTVEACALQWVKAAGGSAKHSP